MIRYRIIAGDCLAEMPKLHADGVQVDSVVTDPPYFLKFMGKLWDDPGTFVERRPDRAVKFDQQCGNHNPSNPQDAARTRLVEGLRAQAFHQQCATAVYPLLKPGGHLIALCGTRTEHRVVCAIEDAGFEIRDRLLWLYGSGFPKSHNLNDDWQGWGTALKPAVEIAVLARKPLSESSVAANVLKHGTGALNIDESRVGVCGGSAQPSGMDRFNARNAEHGYRPNGYQKGTPEPPEPAGRWPANVLHDGSPEVLEAFARFGKLSSGTDAVKNISAAGANGNQGSAYGAESRRKGTPMVCYGDTGTAARFFYCAKASRKERAGTTHPTVKPLALMEWLIRLITPPGGTVLDPFVGSGSTLIACARLEFGAIGIEQDEGTVKEAQARCRNFGLSVETPTSTSESEQDTARIQELTNLWFQAASRRGT